MGVTFLDAEGKEKPAEMGCYGIGVTRIVAAAIEQSHDKDGIIWPVPLAPYEVAVLELQQDDPNVVATATRIYDELTAAGIEVLYDDRNERAGVKFKDADLIGLPFRIAVGKKGLAEGVVEVKRRNATEVGKMKIDDVVKTVAREVARGAWLVKLAHDIPARERVIVALDVPDLAGARQAARSAGRAARRSTRSGLELFVGEGERAIELVRARGGRVFLDLKLHDIPETVARAVASAARNDAELLTVHTSGGYEMLSRAADAAAGQGEDPRRDGADQPRRGRPARRGDRADDPGDGAGARAHRGAGGDRGAGLLAAARSRRRAAAAPGLLIVVPGIRPAAGAGAAKGDQKRVATAGAGDHGGRRLPGGRAARSATPPIRRRRSKRPSAKSKPP